MNWIDEIQKRITENDLVYLPVESSVDLGDVKRLIKALNIAIEALDEIAVNEYYKVAIMALFKLECLGKEVDENESV
jgi:hypothetical protein